MDARFEELKSELFNRGQEAVEDFLGYEIDSDEDMDVTDRRMDMAYEQMPEDVIDKFFKKYLEPHQDFGLDQNESIVGEDFAYPGNESDKSVRNLISAMVAYGVEHSLCDSDIIESLVSLGITYEDFCNVGARDFVKDYFEEKGERKTSLNEKMAGAAAKAKIPVEKENNKDSKGLKPYRISITETYKKEVEIYAEDSLAAEEMAEDLCNNGDIDLDFENFVERNTECRGVARSIDLELHDVYGMDLLEDQSAWKVGYDRILTLQTCDDGWDYTLYDSNYMDLDGGQLDCLDMSMEEARTVILKSFGLENHRLRPMVYEEVLSSIEQVLVSNETFKKASLAEQMAGASMKAGQTSGMGAKTGMDGYGGR